MDQTVVTQLMDKWMNDEGFRASLRTDPEGTIKATGLTLDDDQWRAVRNIDWSQSDEELTARASNSGGCACSASC